MFDTMAEGGWAASLKEYVKNHLPNHAEDQARLTADRMAEIFAERREREKRQQQADGNASGNNSVDNGGKRRKAPLPRFFIRPPVVPTLCPSSHSAGLVGGGKEQTEEESRMAAIRSKLKAKARARFLQRREEALLSYQEMAEMEEVLSTCAPPVRAPVATAAAAAELVAGTDPIAGNAGPSTGNSGVKADGDTGDKQESGSSADGIVGTATRHFDGGEELAVKGVGGAGAASAGAGAGAGAGDDEAGVADIAQGREYFTASERFGVSANYWAFVNVRGKVSRKAASFFTARSFLRFPRDIRGRIPSQMFSKYVYDSVSLQKIKITLHFYDSEGLGYLREQDLENYIYDHIPSMPALHAIHDNFYPFYVFTAVRRFMFFLDPRRTGKISIDSLVRSRIMQELLELRMVGIPSSNSKNKNNTDNGDGNEGKGGAPSSGEETDGIQRADDADAGRAGGSADAPPSPSPPPPPLTLPAQDLSKNWFSAENTLRVYGEYLELDADQNGMLSKTELINFGARARTRLTPIFIQRLFQEVVTYQVPVPVASPRSPSPPSRTETEDDVDDGRGGGNRSPTMGNGASPPPAHGTAAAAAGVRSAQGDSPPPPARRSEEMGGGRRRGKGGEGRTTEGEMDYKTFLDLVLAMENIKQRQSLQYFWRVLDADGTGRMTTSTINVFFRDVVSMLKEGGCEIPNVGDVKDEIFDMVKPKDPTYITWADLLRSGTGPTIVSMLIDTHGFWQYENRENLKYEAEDDPTPLLQSAPAAPATYAPSVAAVVPSPAEAEDVAAINEASPLPSSQPPTEYVALTPWTSPPSSATGSTTALSIPIPPSVLPLSPPSSSPGVDQCQCQCQSPPPPPRQHPLPPPSDPAREEKPTAASGTTPTTCQAPLPLSSFGDPEETSTSPGEKTNDHYDDDTREEEQHGTAGGGDAAAAATSIAAAIHAVNVAAFPKIMSVQPVPADGAGGYGGEGAGAGVVVSTAASDGRSMRVGIPCGSGLELSSKRREDGTAAAGFAGVWCDDEQRSPVQEAARVAVRVVAAAAAVGGVTEKVAELRLEGAL